MRLRRFLRVLELEPCPLSEARCSLVLRPWPPSSDSAQSAPAAAS